MWIGWIGWNDGIRSRSLFSQAVHSRFDSIHEAARLEFWEARLIKSSYQSSSVISYHYPNHRVPIPTTRPSSTKSISQQLLHAFLRHLRHQAHNNQLHNPVQQVLITIAIAKHIQHLCDLVDPALHACSEEYILDPDGDKREDIFSASAANEDLLGSRGHDTWWPWRVVGKEGGACSS